MKIALSQTQLQRQIMAPSMQQSIEVLLLPVMELNKTIDQELQDNPLLEIAEKLQEQASRELNESLNQQLDRLSLSPDFNYQWHNTDDDILEERPIEEEETLEKSLLQQLRIECSDPLEIKIGEFIIGNIDEDGYLIGTTEEISQALGVDNPGVIERVLNIIRALDPPGIASRDLKECLLAQFKEKTNHNGHKELVLCIIRDFLKELGQKKYARIAKKLKVSIEDVKEAARIIASLNPRPASNYQPLSANIYIKPDVVIAKKEGEYQLHINEKDIPPLKINPRYKDLLRQHNLSAEDREFIREKLHNAILFIKSIQQRGTTLKGISHYILNKQKAFFDNGHMALVPMTLKDVAGTLNRNESTISRAISNKYIDTPRGVYPMKFFFSQAVGSNGHNGGGNNNGENNGSVSNRSIKEEIKELIASENRSGPLSDSDIQKYFENKGMKIARRTINKYRHILKILPSHLRKD